MRKSKVSGKIEKKIAEVEQQIAEYSMYVAACVRGIEVVNDHVAVKSTEEPTLYRLVEKLRLLYEMRDFLKSVCS